MTITFTVGNPVATNNAYGRRKADAGGGFAGGKGFFLKPEGRAFKMRLVAAATVARARSQWPADPWRVAKARVSYQLFNYRGDTDGPRKFIRDSLERLLYVNDRCVEDGPSPLPIVDALGKRVVVTVELLEVRSAEDAAKLRVAKAKRDAANLKRRIAKMQQRKTGAA